MITTADHREKMRSSHTMSRANPTEGDSRPDIADSQAENQWTQLARKHWSKPLKTRKVKSDVIKKEIWDVLENEGFQLPSLLVLENLQLLEKSDNPSVYPRRSPLTSLSYLWPGFTDACTNHHVLLIAIIATVKNRENLPVWGESIPIRVACLHLTYCRNL